MGIKSTKRVYRATALRIIKQEIERITQNGSCRDIESLLEDVLDIYNEKSPHYFDNFDVVPDDYEPETWENVY